MDDEKPIGVVLLFYFSQSRVVASPIRPLPALLEIVALAHVRSAFSADRPKFIHASIDALRCTAAQVSRRLVPGNSRIGGAPTARPAPRPQGAPNPPVPRGGSC